MNEQILAPFKESTGYDVEIQTSDWGAAFQRITTSAASNSLPDLILIGGIWTAPLASKGALLDITDRFAGWDQGDQFYDGMVEDSEWEGALYAIPFITDVRSGVYRQDILDEAGVTELPQTWQQFRECAEAVKELGTVQAPIDWGLNTSIGIQQAFAQLFLQAGGEYYDENGKAQFMSDPGIKSLEFLVGTYLDGLADYNLVDNGSGASPVVAGTSAQCFTGANIKFNAETNMPEVVEHLVSGPALKMDEASEPTPVAWVNKFAISATTKDPDGAWELLTYLTGAEKLGDLARVYGGLPPREDLANEEWIGEFEKQVLDSAPDAISQPPDPRMLEIGPAITELLDPAIRGLATVEETLEAIDERIDSIDA
ncbi:MAG TPA: sugar ABC transporter substrate-binding protein [Candidatus Brachybacterium merdigallinarum]|nr:sugar ABC transporter substrate-binding protein [Candidatus Brachybacterium merdigallinarum]